MREMGSRYSNGAARKIANDFHGMCIAIAPFTPMKFFHWPVFHAHAPPALLRQGYFFLLENILDARTNMPLNNLMLMFMLNR